jgi:hypothetical protein
MIGKFRIIYGPPPINAVRIFIPINDGLHGRSRAVIDDQY